MATEAPKMLCYYIPVMSLLCDLTQLSFTLSYYIVTIYSYVCVYVYIAMCYIYIATCYTTCYYK